MNKKTKVAFLVDNYYPKFSPVAKCAYNIAEELSNTYEVFIITLDGKSLSLTTEEHNKQKILRCSTPLLLERKEIENNLTKSKVLKAKLFFIRLKGYLKAIFSKINIDNEIVDSYYSALEIIKPEVVIPICLPFEAVIAALNYKQVNSNTILVPFLFDRFTYNRSLQRNKVNLLIKRKAHVRLENSMLEYSDHILAMHQLRENFNIVFSDNMDKITYVEHPLLKKNKNTRKTIDDGKTRLIYAGALYKNYRSPEYLLKVFTLIEGSYLLNFFSAGNCEEMIDKFSYRDKRIKKNGYVSVDVLDEEYSNADILLSIGNFKSQNLASKIFEYMSLGKPIIHFYENPNDPVLNLLNKYPLSLTVEQKSEDIKLNANRIQEFCTMNKGKIIGFDVVREKFIDATPEYISQTFIEIIERHNVREH